MSRCDTSHGFVLKAAAVALAAVLGGGVIATTTATTTIQNEHKQTHGRHGTKLPWPLSEAVSYETAYNNDITAASNTVGLYLKQHGHLYAYVCLRAVYCLSRKVLLPPAYNRNLH